MIYIVDSFDYDVKYNYFFSIEEAEEFVKNEIKRLKNYSSSNVEFTIYESDDDEEIKESIKKIHVDLERLDAISDILDDAKGISYYWDKNDMEKFLFETEKYENEYGVDFDFPNGFEVYSDMDYDEQTKSFDSDFILEKDVDFFYEFGDFEPEEYEEVNANARKIYNKGKYKVIKTIEKEYNSVLEI